MGMIRVSDHAEKIIKGQANGRTITATVDALVAGSTVLTPPQDYIIGKLDYLKDYIDKKFSHLESLIEDTAVDRIDSGGPKRSKVCYRLPWEGCMQDIYFDFEDDDPCWLPGVKAAWGESDFMDTVAFESDGEYIYDATTKKVPMLLITPALRSYLNKKGFEV